MPIEFHCNHCGKLIRASDDHGGKRGKCPSCQQSVYIPAPDDQIEPLEITPLDSAAERERQRLLRETRELEARVLREKGAPGESGPAGRGGARPPSGGAPRGAPQEHVRDFEPSMPLTRHEMEALVIRYVRAMADGKLPQAEDLAREIHRNMPLADTVMQQLAVDELPPEEIAKVPRPVLIAFFKQLREQR